jgi:hypothetical protein
VASEQTKTTNSPPPEKSALEIIADFLLTSQPIDANYKTYQEAAAALIGRLVRAGYGLRCASANGER